MPNAELRGRYSDEIPVQSFMGIVTSSRGKFFETPLGEIRYRFIANFRFQQGGLPTPTYVYVGELLADEILDSVHRNTKVQVEGRHYAHPRTRNGVVYAYEHRIIGTRVEFPRAPQR